jgi:tRNA threonylcarbamoyladenosine biosynthesis protein TsaB
MRASQLSEQPRALSHQLFSALQTALDEAGWALDEVDALAVGLGPGSWTGLRIGLSAAKTLAQTRGWKIVGVPSFDATAQAVSSACTDTSTLLMVATPCRPGEIYAEMYAIVRGTFAVLHGAWIVALELAATTLAAEAVTHGVESPLLLTGGAASAVGEILTTMGQPHSLVETKLESVLLALAGAGAAKLADSKQDEALALQPLYLAPSNAERNLLAR